MTRPLNMADERDWFDSLGDDGVQFLLRADGDRVGTIGFRQWNGEWATAEVGYFFHPHAWGNGYATDAVGRFVRFGFEERRLAKVWAEAYAYNDASQRVLEKVGFEHEATLRDQAFADGARVDVERFGLLADEWQSGADSARSDE